MCAGTVKACYCATHISSLRKHLVTVHSCLMHLNYGTCYHLMLEMPAQSTIKTNQDVLVQRSFQFTSTFNQRLFYQDAACMFLIVLVRNQSYQ